MLIFMFHNILLKAHFWVWSKDLATPTPPLRMKPAAFVCLYTHGWVERD